MESRGSALDGVFGDFVRIPWRKTVLKRNFV